MRLKGTCLNDCDRIKQQLLQDIEDKQNKLKQENNKTKEDTDKAIQQQVNENATIHNNRSSELQKVNGDLKKVNNNIQHMKMEMDAIPNNLKIELGKQNTNQGPIADKLDLTPLFERVEHAELRLKTLRFKTERIFLFSMASSNWMNKI